MRWQLMKLQYVVLTSVDRDDLADGGAAHYAACVLAIHERSPATAIEALTPDFAGRLGDVATVLDAGLITYAQNLETVERLTHPVRDPRAGYAQTLAVLAFAKRHAPRTLTKTSLMLGLGETDAELDRTFDDIRAAGVDVVTLGQYMRPTPHHLPVERFVTPEQFNATASWRWARVSSKWWPARWCGPVIAPNACWNTTTPGCSAGCRADARATTTPCHRLCNGGCDFEHREVFHADPQSQARPGPHRRLRAMATLLRSRQNACDASTTSTTNSSRVFRPAIRRAGRWA